MTDPVTVSQPSAMSISSDSHRVHPGKVRFLIGIVLTLCVVGVTSWYFAGGISDEERRAIILEKIPQGDFETVREHLEVLVNHEPDNEELLLYLFETCLRLDDIDAAFLVFQRVSKISTGLIVERGLQLASASFDSGHEQITRDCLQSVQRAAPGNESALRLQLQLESLLLRRDAVIKIVAQLDEFGLAQPMDLFSFYMTDEPKWEGSEQIAWLKTCHSHEPENARVLAALVRVHLAHKDFEPASQLLSEVDNDDVLNQPELVVARSVYEMETGNRNDSAKTLQSLSGKKVTAYTWRLKGLLLSKKEDKQKAAEAFQQVLALDPSDLPSMVRLIKLKSALQQADTSIEELISRLKTWNRYLQIRSDSLSIGAITDRQMQDLVEIFVDLNLMRPAAICANTLSVSGRDESTLGEHIRRIEMAPDSLEPLALPPISIAKWNSIEVQGQPGEIDLGSSLPSLDEEPRKYFEDVTVKANLDFQHESGSHDANILLQSLGSGVAAVDFDLDGWPDLAFPQGGLILDDSVQKKPDQIYRNLEGRSFLNVTSEAGFRSVSYSHGCASGDFNNDGFLDLFLSGFGRNTLLYNNGDGTFDDVTETARIGDQSWSATSAWYDLDQDGDLDLYVTGYCDATLERQLQCEQTAQTSCRPVSFPAQSDQVLINQGDGFFVDESSQYKVIAERGLGVLIDNFNHDNKPQIFIGNDMGPNFFFVPSPKTGADSNRVRFVEEGHLAGVAVSGEGVAEACMGMSTLDVDRDGFLDLLVTNYEGETNTLYKNQGGYFIDQTRQVRLAVPSYSMLAWGVQALDVNGDGWQDLVIANSHLHGHPMQGQININQQGRLFSGRSASNLDPMTQKRMGRGISRLDWNRDGTHDVVITTLGGSAVLLQGTSGNSMTTLRFVGRESPRDAMGTHVELKTTEFPMIRSYNRGGGYLTSNEPAIKLPVDTLAATVLQVNWPSGLVENFQNFGDSSEYLLIEGQGFLDIDSPRNR